MKTMKSVLAVAVTTALMATSLQASAALTLTRNDGAAFSSQLNALNIDFGVSPENSSGPVFGSVSVGDTVYSGSQGSVSYQYVDGALYNFPGPGHPSGSARPVGSTGNYYSVGSNGSQIGPGTATFNTNLSYFGFLWSSPDVGNTIKFYNGSTHMGTFTGLNLPVNDGSQGFGTYINIFAGAGESFNRIEFSYTSNAFETDNHSFITAVPEPESYVLLLAGLGLMATIARRRQTRS